MTLATLRPIASGRGPAPCRPSRRASSTGPYVSAETARRLACDASVVVMTHDRDGNVLDVGRKRRTPPPALRRALDPWTATPDWEGDRLDLDWALLTLR